MAYRMLVHRVGSFPLVSHLLNGIRPQQRRLAILFVPTYAGIREVRFEFKYTVTRKQIDEARLLGSSFFRPNSSLTSSFKHVKSGRTI